MHTKKNQLTKYGNYLGGERKDVTDHHNELLVTFLTSKKIEGEKFKVRFRLFNTSRG
ncbi:MULTISPECIES: hypothetical protein [unclassified Colwellia]|uniref:hypothetical protein n=1 Tax=unclassified Colwellia TaxID=196834 RepID=UPI0015F3F8A1|nr:hypothetical protein [Colwellia sp. MB02u-7]MBA6235784.1 hypothetical protein [Colwellia sp. MB02u-11]MBA6254971.1 hypothetical protein [Colwellia sp. MB3u-28]MBA6259078.1 hypothetical protein [Colwellia sp. MB3u-41]MBA6298873.1 hypothetical protein [Colwellia sp. MB3u-22]MBA6302114.1 hypothetical protein [Colwellia sp. MB02u-14]MBA6309839.1 hypothetical protein [Colwellia sp. MB3u-64]